LITLLIGKCGHFSPTSAVTSHRQNQIDAYRALSGVPVVLNTSFNGADEPIVCTPDDAVRTYLACGLDALVIGPYVVDRP
jgi:predicted NodU family carbamoyl transferase